MESYPHLRDEYLFTKDRILLTDEQLCIPGVQVFGHHMLYNAFQSLSWHYHEDAFEFSMPAKGSFTFSTLDGNYPYSGGDVFISFPNEVHGTNQTPVTVGELYWFQLDISDEDQFLFLKPKAAHSMISQLRDIPGHVIHTELEKTLPLVETAFDLAKAGDDGLLIASFLQLFLHQLIMYSRKEPSRLSPDIIRSRDYILANLTAELPLDYLASLASLSCSQFKQKFKKQLGIAPRHYINQQKVEYAKTLLLEGTSVTETAMLLNFSTSGYFSTVFKKYTLYTPSEYLRLQMTDKSTTSQ